MRFGENFCPGVVHAVEAKDGLLVRIRVPGGLIEPDQMRAVGAVAERFGDGSVEITSRANLQVRAIRRENQQKVVEELVAAGLLPSAMHDRVRNIVTSPFAGLEEGEWIDPRPLVRDLDARLRDEVVFSELHPKFSFAVYGGNKRFCRDVDDVCVSAVRMGETTPLRLWLVGADTGWVVAEKDAVDVLLAAAKLGMMLAEEFGVVARMRQILAVEGARERMLAGLEQWLSKGAEGGEEIVVEAVVPGIRRTRFADRVSVVPTVALGRLRAEQVRVLADVARASGGDLRLAPWRGIVLGSVTQRAAKSIVRELGAAGLSCEGSGGFYGIAACAGIGGCDASLADVRADAAALAKRLVGEGIVPGWSVNISGCEKQCGRRRGAVAELVATASGYNLRIDGVDGMMMKQDCTALAAIDAVAAEHGRLKAEVVAG